MPAISEGKVSVKGDEGEESLLFQIITDPRSFSD